MIKDMKNIEGFWGKQTATIGKSWSPNLGAPSARLAALIGCFYFCMISDWCELNYEVTYYIAEFWNTVSNLVMILFPLYGIYWSLQHSKVNKSFRIPLTIIWCYLGLILVGIGSWMFHMTLLYKYQLLDELPMVFGSGLLIYGNYDLIMATIRLREHKRTKKSTLRKIFDAKFFVLALIATYCLTFAYTYVTVWTDPIFHEIVYGIMVFVIMFENIWLIKRLELSKRLYVTSLVYYLLGFFLWNVDNKMCDYLRSYRASLEQFFGIQANAQDFKSVLLNSAIVSLKSVLELHALWHIFTGYAAYMTILFLKEAHYKRTLLEQGKTSQAIKRPVESKFYQLYYHLAELNEAKKPRTTKRD